MTKEENKSETDIEVSEVLESYCYFELFLLIF